MKMRKNELVLRKTADAVGKCCAIIAFEKRKEGAKRNERENCE